MVEVWIGFAAGVLIGATGAGTGSLATPLLILAGYRPAVAVGTGLGVLVVSKFTGALAHHQMGHWPGRAAWALVAGGATGVGLAWWLAHNWLALGSPEVDLWLRRVLAATLLVSALGLLLTHRNGGHQPVVDAENNRVAFFLSGLGVATLVTLTSAGSGSLLVPVLAVSTAWGVPQLAAMSNLFGWVVGALAVALHVREGFFDTRLFAQVLLGLVPGVLAGALLSRRIARRWFVRSFALLAVYLGVKLLLG